VRFLLYNIRYGTGVGSRFHLPVPYAGFLKRSTGNYNHICEFISEIQPDIVGLVEVDSGSFRTDNCCQAELLARQLGYNHIIESKYQDGSITQRVPLLCNQGNALLTRLDIVEHRFHFFKQGVKRLVIEVRTEEVTVFLVHLSLTYRNRQNQLQQLYKMVAQVEGPVIVAGDFNVLWGNHELELFLAATGLSSANNEGKPSHPSHAPTRQLDYILHSQDLAVTGFSIPRVTFSDHAPLVCDLEKR
jgi:endonuclease/exonuclease/phosphatase family metal-dependent hydrolase